MEGGKRRRPGDGVVDEQSGDEGPGERLEMEEVQPSPAERDGHWAFEELDPDRRALSAELNAVALSRAEFAELGEAIVTRLVAAHKRVQ